MFLSPPFLLAVVTRGQLDEMVQIREFAPAITQNISDLIKGRLWRSKVLRMPILVRLRFSRFPDNLV